LEAGPEGGGLEVSDIPTFFLSFLLAVFFSGAFWSAKCAFQSYFQEGSYKMRLVGVLFDEFILLISLYLIEITKVFPLYLSWFPFLFFFIQLRMTIEDFSKLSGSWPREEDQEHMPSM
jgi:hypothetical protein